MKSFCFRKARKTTFSGWKISDRKGKKDTQTRKWNGEFSITAFKDLSRKILWKGFRTWNSTCKFVNKSFHLKITMKVLCRVRQKPKGNANSPSIRYWHGKGENLNWNFQSSGFTLRQYFETEFRWKVYSRNELSCFLCEKLSLTW